VLIRRAKALLSGETLSISRIAAELGYADAAHFSRAFLDWTGTPQAIGVAVLTCSLVRSPGPD
jgi:AraC-like DNA-binding protein